VHDPLDPSPNLGVDAAMSLDKRLMPSLPTLAPSDDTLTSLRGLRASGVRAGIKPSGLPDVALLVAATPMHAAGIFTQCKVAASPVLVCRAHLLATGGKVRALVVNSGNANACTGAQGLADAHAMCAQVARALGCASEEVLVCSTGVIGHPLPMAKVHAGIDAALGALSGELDAGRRFLQAMMTTDAFPKEASARLGPDGPVVAGVCKGAGMIHPNMATMLAVVATDAAASTRSLAEALPRIAAQSFNAVHVDTHPSTNDTLLLFSTGPEGALDMPVLDGITEVARRLAWLIARDGEGATKVTTIGVRGATTSQAARAIADRVASSALVRTALYGNDPNWGRFVSQVGNAPEVVRIEPLRCVLQGVCVYENGAPTSFDRADLSRAMRAENVTLDMVLADGDGEAVLMTSDLGYRYIEVNAEYTT
jgi:glutamate N-acetyltransferase/amino-acid N-acetyltransferase